MVELFSTIIYNPLYNAVIGLVDVVPGAQLGIAVIILTLFVKIVLFPISLKGSKTQQVIRKMQPKLEELKKEHKDDRQQLALKTMELYREYDLHPLALFVPLLLQIPVIIGLFWVFSHGGLPELNTDIIYGFIPIPDRVNMEFLGLIDIGGKSILLALLTGATQYIQMKIMMPPLGPRDPESSFGQDFQRSFQIQMKYIFPVLITGIAYALPAAVALYWITSNLFQIGQEYYVRSLGLRDSEQNT